MNVFSNAQVVRGAMRADKLEVSFGPITAGMLAQNIQFNFSQQVTMLFEVGNNDVYLIAGRAQGTAGISRVVGPTQLASEFFRKFGDACEAPTNTLSFRARGGCVVNGVRTGAGIKYTLSGCVINSVGGSVGAQDVVISEQIQMMYVNLDRE